MLSRNLGPEAHQWDPRCQRDRHDGPAERGTIWIRLQPASLTAKDLSYHTGPSPAGDWLRIHRS
jgi:hypothetical protein